MIKAILERLEEEREWLLDEKCAIDALEQTEALPVIDHVLQVIDELTNLAASDEYCGHLKAKVLGGCLEASSSMDEEYPGLWISLKNKEGIETPIVLVEEDEKKIRVVNYPDFRHDEPKIMECVYNNDVIKDIAYELYRKQNPGELLSMEEFEWNVYMDPELMKALLPEKIYEDYKLYH